ncbi:hypothetical protein R3P38DRAFT_2589948 [Favolaschia claudopus]|uniref:Uncharacterized protein n=1 Tax=Favolaschia claudopus TaxID=2862362 RepID=A0AAV9Z1G6_9AGAR
MAGLQSHTARLVGLFVGCLLYGILCLTFLFFIMSASRIQRIILGTVCAMFCVATFGVCTALKNVIDAFVLYSGPGGAEFFYNTENGGWTHSVPILNDALQVILTDLLLIHKCHILYNRRWMVTTPPLFLTMLSIVCGSIAAVKDARLPGTENVNSPEVFGFITATFCLTILTNLLTTIFILRRLIEIESICESSGGNIRPYFIGRLILLALESGILYVFFVSVSFTIFLSGSNFKYVLSLAVRIQPPSPSQYLH